MPHRMSSMTKRTSRAFLVVAFLSAAAPLAMGRTGRPCPEPIFDNPEYLVGARPFAIASADLDGDGDADLVTANFIEATISVLLNNGDGTFADAVAYQIGFFQPFAATEPASVAIGDLDDDGDLDLVVSSARADFGGNLPGIISVLLNAGDGTFPDQVIHGTGLGPFSVALEDLDDDGDLDIAVAMRDSDGIQIFFNNGGGSFVFGMSFSAGDFPDGMVIGDLDGDGDPDFAVTNWTENVVSVLLNNGDGSFGPRVTYSAGVGPLASAISDLDGDGDLDLVVADLGPNDSVGMTVSVLLNDGNGAFPNLVSYGVDERPSDVAISDLDADGHPDVVVTSLFDDTVSVLMNNGDATFGAQVTYSVGQGPASSAAADLDGDGDLDLAVANEFGNTVSPPCIVVYSTPGTLHFLAFPTTSGFP